MRIPSPLFNGQQAALLIKRRNDEPRPNARPGLGPYCRRYGFQSARPAYAAGVAQ
ncbi:hypothetical protein ACVWYF_004328 [Hymenobacter sp. UYAg731]